MPDSRNVRRLVLLAAALLPPAVAARADRTVCRDDFADRPGPRWSHADRFDHPAADGPLLGPFHNRTVSLTLTDLPDHAAVTVRADLLILGGWTGSVPGASGNRAEGPDQWGLAVAGGPALIHATFSNAADDGPAQSFPAFMGLGSAPPRTGAAGSARDDDGPAWSLYRLSYTFAHRRSDLALEFYGLGLASDGKEVWGLDSVTVTTAAQPPPAPDEKALAAAWDDLIGPDAEAGERAVRTLAAGGDRAVRLIARRLKSEDPEDLGIDRLLARLDHDDWQVREAATAELKKLGRKAVGPLRRAYKRADSAEVRLRIERVLAAADKDPPGPDDPRVRRRLRAVRVLELMGTERSERLLARLTGATTGPAALSAGSEWQGVWFRPGPAVALMSLTVMRRDGRRVEGVMLRADAGVAGTRFKGALDGARFRLTETEAVSGRHRALPVFYRGRVVGQTLTGSWRGRGGAGGTFRLRLLPRPDAQQEAP